jgi:formylglycine-generating enzyme required for sulfatase activity
VDDNVSQDEIEKATAFQTFVDLFYRCKKHMVTVCTALVVIIVACIVDLGSLFAPSSPSADPEPLVHNDDSLISTVVDTLNANKTEFEPVKPQPVKTYKFEVPDIVDDDDESSKKEEEVPRTNIAIASQDYVGGTDNGINSDDLKKAAGDKMSPTQNTSDGTSSSLSFTKNTEFSVVNKGNVRVYTVKGVTFKMIKVHGGTFLMGATPAQIGADDDEKPVHRVTLSDYYIGETEVTQELWTAVMGINPSYHTGNTQLPVEKVSWDDCQTFISKLNALTGENFRLPTEAQWEFAARGGNKSRGNLYSGGNSLGDVVWYYENSGNKTHAVKTKSPNELGLYDMSGNVWEWCRDWYGGYSSAAVTNPIGPASGTDRVIRGGCWLDDAQYCRVAYRSYGEPECYVVIYLGLRLAL